ncbi:MAG: hypothetical protein RLZZ28_1479 [Bacteroidota bacterium]
MAPQKNNRYSKKRLQKNGPLFIFLLFLSPVCIKLKAQDSFDIKKASFLLPRPQPKGKFSQAFSIYMVVPPKDWTLDIVNAPMLNYSAKYSLKNGFNLQASLSTLFVSNRLSAGPFWNYSKNNFHLGIGYQLVYNLGILKSFGFNTIFTAVEHQPSITYGQSFKKTALTIRGELYYSTWLQVSEGGNKIPFNDDFINGFSLTTSFEQRLYKNKLASLGLKMSYLRYHILAWPALPVNSYQYLVPEFQLGINL